MVFIDVVILKTFFAVKFSVTLFTNYLVTLTFLTFYESKIKQDRHFDGNLCLSRLVYAFSIRDNSLDNHRKLSTI